jgi:hypothetical protein
VKCPELQAAARALGQRLLAAGSPHAVEVGNEA